MISFHALYHFLSDFSLISEKMHCYISYTTTATSVHRGITLYSFSLFLQYLSVGTGLFQSTSFIAHFIWNLFLWTYNETYEPEKLFQSQSSPLWCFCAMLPTMTSSVLVLPGPLLLLILKMSLRPRYLDTSSVPDYCFPTLGLSWKGTTATIFPKSVSISHKGIFIFRIWWFSYFPYIPKQLFSLGTFNFASLKIINVSFFCFFSHKFVGFLIFIFGWLDFSSFHLFYTGTYFHGDLVLALGIYL